MAKFLTTLKDEKIGPERWRLIGKLEQQTDFDLSQYDSVKSLPYIRSENGKHIITAPEGFETDYASIPQIAQFLISKVGPWDLPSVIHDLLYKMQLFGVDEKARKLCDQIFLEGMIAEGVGAIRRQIIYRAVRVGGRKAWNQHKKANEKIASSRQSDATAEP